MVDQTLEEGLLKILDVLERQVSHDDRAAQERKLSDCVNLVGTSAKLKAQAHKEMQDRQSQIIKANPQVNSRMLRFLIDAGTVQESTNLVLAEKVSSSLHRAIEGLKALLNIRKEESMEWGG